MSSESCFLSTPWNARLIDSAKQLLACLPTFSEREKGGGGEGEEAGTWEDGGGSNHRHLMLYAIPCQTVMLFHARLEYLICAMTDCSSLYFILCHASLYHSVLCRARLNFFLLCALPDDNTCQTIILFSIYFMLSHARLYAWCCFLSKCKFYSVLGQAVYFTLLYSRLYTYSVLCQTRYL